ncbi:hypothetical protein OF83DRAFT_722619 [Amylostereum chailletii]|nr:hypothetical protein OF83DRAFT_722619 [Amylostereum chailletii]
MSQMLHRCPCAPLSPLPPNFQPLISKRPHSPRPQFPPATLPATSPATSSATAPFLQPTPHPICTSSFQHLITHGTWQISPPPHPAYDPSPPSEDHATPGTGPGINRDIKAWVRRCANGYELTPENRTLLHAHAQLISTVPSPFFEAFGVQMAATYQTQQIITANQASFENFTNALGEIKTALAERQGLTEVQRDEVRAVTKRVLFKPGRTDFGLVEEIMALKSAIGSEASNAKQALRTVVKDTLFTPKKKCGPSAAALRMSNRLVNGSADSITPAHIIWVIIIRAFAREHKSLLLTKAGDGELEGTNASDGSGQHDGDALSDADERPEVGSKRKSKGRPPEGTDFFSVLEQDFQVKCKEWGRDFEKGEHWRRFVDKQKRLEKREFTNDEIPLLPDVNPVLLSSTSVNNLQAFAGLAAQYSGPRAEVTSPIHETTHPSLQSQPRPLASSASSRSNSSFRHQSTTPHPPSRTWTPSSQASSSTSTSIPRPRMVHMPSPQAYSPASAPVDRSLSVSFRAQPGTPFQESIGSFDEPDGFHNTPNGRSDFY